MKKHTDMTGPEVWAACEQLYGTLPTTQHYARALADFFGCTWRQARRWIESGTGPVNANALRLAVRCAILERANERLKAKLAGKNV
jgi:hypothetical protein